MGIPATIEASTVLSAETATIDDTAEIWLGRWMIGVAVVYLLLFANLASLVLVPARLTQLSPAFDAPISSVAAQVTIDALLMFGLELAVIAVVLLLASRNPLRHAVLVWLVIGLELVRGIADDLYLLLFRDYVVDEFYYGFIVLHVVIIATGYLAYRRATTAEAA